MPVTFAAYIDESGDTGLDLVKKPDDPRGATEWLVLSAFVVKIEHDSKMVAWTTFGNCIGKETQTKWS
jgi:hypothetical protein